MGDRLRRRLYRAQFDASPNVYRAGFGVVSAVKAGAAFLVASVLLTLGILAPLAPAVVIGSIVHRFAPGLPHPIASTAVLAYAVSVAVLWERGGYYWRNIVVSICIYVVSTMCLMMYAVSLKLGGVVVQHVLTSLP